MQIHSVESSTLLTNFKAGSSSRQPRQPGIWGRIPCRG